MDIIISLIGISIVVALLIVLVKWVLIIRKPHKLMDDSITLYIFNLFMAVIIYLLAEFINLIFCYQAQTVISICLATSQIYAIITQVALCWLTVLCIALNYILTTEKDDFKAILQKSNRDFIIICWILPLIINILAFLDYVWNSDNQVKLGAEDVNIFTSSMTPDQYYSIVIPNILLIILSIVFTSLTIRRVRTIKLMTPHFKARVITEQYIIIIGLLLAYLPQITLQTLVFKQILSLEQDKIMAFFMVYFNILLAGLYFYLFGINCTIQQIMVLKGAMGRSLHESHLGISNTLSTVTIDNSAITMDMKINRFKSVEEKKVSSEMELSPRSEMNSRKGSQDTL